MRAFRRISRRLRLYFAVSIVLAAAVLITSSCAPSLSKATTCDTSVPSESIPAQASEDNTNVSKTTNVTNADQDIDIESVDNNGNQLTGEDLEEQDTASSDNESSVTESDDSSCLTDEDSEKQDPASSDDEFSVTYEYDDLGRITKETSIDGTTTIIDYSIPGQKTVTNPMGYKMRYYYDDFERLVKVEELDTADEVYATTTYSYDTLGNLVQLVDTHGNTTTIEYNELSQKISMTDPDTGTWSYEYDSNGNLQTQTDSKGQTITYYYDELNQLIRKTYPADSGMTDVVYTYDNGLRTSMNDASGTITYQYDAQERLIEEKRTFDGIDYVTKYSYDSEDRLVSITYPTNEVVTQTYNDQGFADTLNGTIVGILVLSTDYNELGDIKQINLGNGTSTTFNYYGLDDEAPIGYYGRLWQIKTLDSSQNVIQDTRYTWDANYNLTERYDAIKGETEYFTYDFLDRLITVSGVYNQTYTYDEIGNITSMNGVSYTYGAKPHAVIAIGNTSYSYDANGNMISGNERTITWDIENMPVSIGDSSYVYDGDGNRILKTENGETILYINKYYEKNLTTGEVITHYYLDDIETAFKNDSSLTFVHQDYLGNTSLITDSYGSIVAVIDYFPFGETRSVGGDLDIDKLYTGQRLDDSGLYYYNARYYDAAIGRFISADTLVPNYTYPQTLNRYAYVYNNPLKYTDPTGHWGWSRLWRATKAIVGTSCASFGFICFCYGLATFNPVFIIGGWQIYSYGLYIATNGRINWMIF